MAEDEVLSKAKAFRSAKFKASRTGASANKSNTPDMKPTSSSGLQALLAGAPTPVQKPEEPKDFWGGVKDVLDQPVIKGILNGISTPLYAVGNTLEGVQNHMYEAEKNTRARAAAKGEEGLGDLGNRIQGAWEGLNPATVAQDVIGGVGKGISAGLGQNPNDAKTTGDVIKNAQNFSGIDTNSDESRAQQLWGGLAGDIVMDPLNAVSLGLPAAGAKGFVRGADKFREAKTLKKLEGVDTPGVEATQWANAKAKAKVEMDNYRQNKLDVEQAKVANKQFKKLTPDKQAEYLLDNLSTLRAPVARALIKTAKKKEEVMAKLFDAPTPKMEEAASKLDDTTPDIIPNDVPDATPRVSLSSVKPPTMDEKLFDVLGRLRTTDKTPRYDPQTIKNVDDAFKAQAIRDASGVGKPDLKSTIAKIKKYDAEERAFNKEMGIAGGAQFPYKAADGKNYSATAEDLINSLDPNDANFMNVFEKLDPEFKTYKSGKSVINDEALRVLGVRNEDIELLKQGHKLGDITDEISVGSIEAIARDIANGEIPDAAIKPFYEIAGTTDRNAIAEFIRTNTKTESYKKAEAALAKYGSHRTGEAPLPHLGVSGHGMQALPNGNHSAEDILSYKTSTSPEQSREFLEAKYNESAVNLAGMKEGATYRNIADRVFESTIDTQRKVAGPRRSKRGASVAAENAPKQTAKFETKYNTMSAMHRVDSILKEVRTLHKGNRGLQDDAFMAILKDVDDRLRLAGFDPHLSNMRTMGDKLVVRLAPSDVYGALTKSQRLDWIHGNPNAKGRVVSQEMLPTTLLDVTEILVRSATRLKPDGTVDFEALAANALRTLQGKFDSLGRGKREIAKNLDARTVEKHDQEILRGLDKLKEENFAELHRAAADSKKSAVVETAMAKYPEEFKALAEKRVDADTLAIFNSLVKGFKEQSPNSFLNEMINTNMRNASVFGGSVAKEIGQATADYTAKVLAALDGGTSGDFLSALVTKPPFEVADDTARQLVSENVAEVQAKLTEPQELAHAKAKTNDAKYQKDTELLTETSKPAKQINTEKVFDLAIRERNRDLLWRAYGTKRYFNKRAGMEYSFDVISNSSHAAALLQTGFQAVIRSWRARGITSEQLRVAMNAIKNDLPDDAVSTELRQVMNTLFDPSKMNFLERNSIGPNHFNKILESVFEGKKFQVNPAADAAEMMESWKNWPITHVEDFLSRMMHAMTKTAEDVSMGSAFSKHFGSAVPQKGYIKVIDKSKKGEENPFFPLINQDLYYPEELVPEITHIGRLMTESRSFKPGTKFHTFVTKVMDPVVSTLKMTQTTMKPGHHVMSVVGDAWRNQLALSTIGLTSPAAQVKLYHESYRILRSSVGEIEELSAFGQLQRIQDLTKGIETGATTTKIDKLGNTKTMGYETFGNIAGGGRITHQDLYAIMQAKGVALPQHLGGMLEDFNADFTGAAGGTGSKVVNAIDKTAHGVDRIMNPLKPKFGMSKPYSMNRFTANRDTWTRGVMFLGAMRSRNFKSVEAATEFAADFVRKWSPTALDLGGFETKYARRAIFYYTWMRGMVPRIIEGTLMNPGVAMIPSKAMYNLGQANGLDLNSIGDPFPGDQLFPDWYSNKVLGPQWKAGGDLWGFNPTGPLGDVMNSLGSGVKPSDFTSPEAATKIGATFLNMSTPWLKAPLELIQGSTVTGTPIEDKAQYAQDMIGPLRTLSRVTGKETYLGMGPNGLDFPNRTEKKYRNGMDGQQTIENALPELLNWATGLQFTNYTSDSASNSAYYQQKQKGVDKSKSDQRFG